METRDAIASMTLELEAFGGKQLAVCDLALLRLCGVLSRSPRHHSPLLMQRREHSQIRTCIYSIEYSHFIFTPSFADDFALQRIALTPLSSQFVAGCRGRAEGLAGQVQQHGPAGAVWYYDRQHEVHVPLLLGQGRARQKGHQRSPLH